MKLKLLSTGKEINFKSINCKECRDCKEQRIVNKRGRCEECNKIVKKEQYQLYHSDYYKKKEKEKREKIAESRLKFYLLSK